MLVPAEIIEKKREGGELAAAEIRFMVEGFLDGRVMEGQMGAFLMAVFLRGMTDCEASDLCRAMKESGRIYNHAGRPHVIDKHSTGGVGDKISIPLAPLAAVCGCTVPMMSGRGLGHTGGTLDKLSALPGFRTDLSEKEFLAVLDAVGCAMIAPTAEIAPADKRMYALRDVTATVASRPLIAASIMSKKLAEGAGALLLDVKVGNGAFLRTRAEAEALARLLVAIGNTNGCRTKALLTNMDQPLGVAVGNALEIRESIEILGGAGPEDSAELTRRLAVEMLLLAAVERDAVQARRRVEEALSSGAALRKFRDLVSAQGGDPAVVENPALLLRAKQTEELCAERGGIIQSIDTTAVGRAGVVLGAGRLRAEEAIDPAVGFEILKKTGEAVSAGEPLVRIHWNESSRLASARERLLRAYVIGDHNVERSPLILGEVA